MATLLYYIQNDPCESALAPNSARIFPTNDVATVRDVLDSFPLNPASFVWRFKTYIHDDPDTPVWADAQDLDAPAPVASRGIVFAKMLRLEGLSVVRRSPGAIRGAASIPTARRARTTVVKKASPPVVTQAEAEAIAQQKIAQRKAREAAEAANRAAERECAAAAALRSDAERDDARAVHASALEAWSGPPDRLKSIRALLSSMHTVLWADSGWQAQGVLVRPKDVKLAYRKAMLLVHPDKIARDADESRKHVAKTIFEALNTQYRVFEAAEAP